MKAYTADEVAELDRYTTEDLGVDLKQLMEVAGLRSAEVALKMLGASLDASTSSAQVTRKDRKKIAVLAGPGGNGGDALVAAKWLKLWGHEPVVLLSHSVDRLRQVTSDQLTIWHNFEGEVREEPPEECDAIIDGLLGYSLQGDPRGKASELITWANGTGKPILALDVPSGLDATTGEVRNPCIKAVHTVVYGVMKKGLLAEGAKEYSGETEIIDIGFPPFP